MLVRSRAKVDEKCLEVDRRNWRQCASMSSFLCLRSTTGRAAGLRTIARIFWIVSDSTTMFGHFLPCCSQKLACRLLFTILLKDLAIYQDQFRNLISFTREYCGIAVNSLLVNQIPQILNPCNRLHSRVTYCKIESSLASGFVTHSSTQTYISVQLSTELRHMSIIKTRVTS
jgi:hypothetical protein